MNHNRLRPKSARAGCLLCKPHKANGADRRSIGELTKAQDWHDRITERE
jgi:hypothetical protein